MKMVTDEQLINYSNLLFYYVKMLMESLNKLCNYPEQPTHWDFDRNTLIEGSLTHARTLIYFLLSKGDREGDIVARFYFYDSDPNPYPIISPSLEGFKKQISKENVHMTTGFGDIFQIKSYQKYDIYGLSQDLIPNLRSFFVNVKGDRLGPEIKEKAITILTVDPRTFYPLIHPVSPST